MRIFFVFLFLARAVSAAQEKAIVDTDSAVFHDDGEAVAMLLQSPAQVQVLGLTLVPGNFWPAQGAEYMFRILDALKKPAVPVYTGARAPLVHTRAMAEKENREWGPIEYLGAFALEDKPGRANLQRRVSRRHAVDFLIDTLSQASDPVTVLEIGPMTNLAIALRLRPDLEKKIKRLVFMGGALHERNYDGRAAEFNFWFDPEAARIVLRSAIPEKVMFGLDICDRARLDKDHFERIAKVKTPLTALYRDDLSKTFSKPGGHTYLWDCLAAGYLIDPLFVTRHESAYVDVDTAFGKNYGAVTALDRAIAPDATPVEVMLDLDFERFFSMYQRLLTEMPQ